MCYQNLPQNHPQCVIGTSNISYQYFLILLSLLWEATTRLEAMRGALAVMGGCLVLSFTGLLTSLLLVVGVKTEQRMLLLPWQIFHAGTSYLHTPISLLKHVSISIFSIFWLENMEIEIIVAGLEIPMGQSIVINRHYIIKSIAPLLASCFCILGLTLLRNQAPV